LYAPSTQPPPPTPEATLGGIVPLLNSAYVTTNKEVKDDLDGTSYDTPGSCVSTSHGKKSMLHHITTCIGKSTKN
jgi:hypothetical protein